MSLRSVRCLLVTFSLLLLPCAAIGIWLGYACYDHPLVGMIGAIQQFDLKGFLFYFCIVLAILLVIVTISGIIISVKSHWTLNACFTFVVWLAALFFVAMGLMLIIVGVQGEKELKTMWDEENADSDFQKAFYELYFYADLIYCLAPPTGCTCYATHNPGTDPRVYVTTTFESLPGVVRNVQGCKDKLEAAYTNYVIPFDDLDDLIVFLDYFGELEDDYNCSGVCNYKPMYYFSDSGDGFPVEKCEIPLREDVLLGQIFPIGIGFLIVGIIVSFVTFVHWGFFCRKDKPGEKDSYKSEDRI